MTRGAQYANSAAITVARRQAWHQTYGCGNGSSCDGVTLAQQHRNNSSSGAPSASTRLMRPTNGKIIIPQRIKSGKRAERTGVATPVRGFDMLARNLSGGAVEELMLAAGK